jgi:hypothetical protein
LPSASAVAPLVTVTAAASASWVGHAESSKAPGGLGSVARVWWCVRLVGTEQEKGLAMGWFTRDEVEPVVVDAVICQGVIYDFWEDDNGVLVLDTDEIDEGIVDGAIVDGVIYDAHVDEHGRLWVEWD